MATVRLTREFSFEMAHVLTGYNGACSQIHGHSYRLFVTVSGTPCEDATASEYGMVMDFGALKRLVGERIVSRYDHTLVLRDTPANTRLIGTLRDHFERIETTPWQPTCERLVLHFVDLIRDGLPDGVRLTGLRLYETAASYAEWLADENR